MTPVEPGSTHRYGFRDYLYWNLLLAVPLLAAASGILRRSVPGGVAYLLLAAGAGVVAYRHFCSHCPLYTHASGRVRCLFFWGMPRFFPAGLGPPSTADKALTGAAGLIVLFFPVPWLLKDIPLLLIYLLSASTLALTLRRIACPRCTYLDCPANRASRPIDNAPS